MITMTKFSRYGRTGNMLFQWAFLSALARKKGAELILPDNPIFQYFEKPPNTGVITTTSKANEPSFSFDPSPYESLDYSKNIDFLGYWQSEKYFDEQTREEVKFKHNYKLKVKEKFASLFTRPTISIGVRRTDYVTSGCYYVLPPLYYITALGEHFPNWRDCNLVFISDDLDYCKFHFGCLENAYFPKSKDVEQLCLMSLCDSHIIANSTFHWWAAWLSGSEKVIQPNHLFAGSLLKQYGDINFYSGKWITHEHEGKKIDLTDVTFTIPVYHDSQDRKTNLDNCLKLISQDFDTTIVVGEQGSNNFHYTPNYKKFDYEKFHRTRMLNEMARDATTKYIANWDCDVAVPPMQLLESVNKLRQGFEMVYPYDGIFHRIRKRERNRLTNDLGVYATDEPNGTPSFGGAVMWNRETFLKIGGENEYMISYAPEDIERHERSLRLGVKRQRTKGNIYHFDHWCGPDSCVANPFFKTNRELLHKQRVMTKDQLLAYINSWPWHVNKDYKHTGVNIIIPYRHEVSNGIELKYALRSIEKHLTGYNHIYLIGDRFPEWITGVRFIEVSEPERKASKNILTKIKQSFAHAGSIVLQWQDDIYLTKDLHIRDIKYWYDGTLERSIERSHGGYKQLVINTALKLTEEFNYFDIHAPIIYRENYFNQIAGLDWDKKKYIVKSLYCKFDTTSESEGEEMKDCKLHEKETKECRLNKIKDALFFSTSPQSIDPAMIEILEELYPEKSKYELHENHEKGVRSDR